MALNANCARIPPVAPGGHRPLWSVLIPTYQDGPYLDEALQSVLSQDRGRDLMEILVMDDASSPSAESRVRDLGGERVVYLRQVANLGKVRNYEVGLRASRGHLIHQLHGDDRILPGFYLAMERAFADHPQAGAFFGRVSYVDSAGLKTGESSSVLNVTAIWPDALKHLLVKQHIQTPSMVCRRTVYEALGGFDRRFDCMEDWEMWIRVANRFPVGFLNATVADYRNHSNNTTSSRLRSGERFSTLRLLHEVTSEYVPETIIADIRRARSHAAAGMWINFIPQSIAERRWLLMWKLVSESLRYDPSPLTLRRCAGVIRLALD